MHKTTLTLLLVCGLSLQACSKTEHATAAAASQAQTEATPPSGIPLSEVGKMAIESNGKAALQQLLDQESPNTYTVTSVNDVKFINQDQNNKGLYNYTWNIRFKENATQNTLGCDHTDVLWDSDKNEVGAGLKNECMNVLEEAQNTPSNTAQIHQQVQHKTHLYASHSNLMWVSLTTTPMSIFNQRLISLLFMVSPSIVVIAKSCQTSNPTHIRSYTLAVS